MSLREREKEKERERGREREREGGGGGPTERVRDSHETKVQFSQTHNSLVQ